MAGVYVYGIAGRPPAAAVKGIFGRRLRVIEGARLFAIVEPAARAPKPTVPRLRAQARVLAALVAAGGDILPSRFGTFVRRPADVKAELLERGPAFRRGLRAVRGCVQISARIALPGGQAPARSPQTTGTAFLRSRAAAVGGAHPAVRALDRAGRAFAKQTRIEADRVAPSIVVHHLVPRRYLRQYLEAVTRAAARRDIAIALSGPWPPFAFLDAE